MDNSGTAFPADRFQVWTVMEQRIDHGPAIFTRCGMNDHACRFVDHDAIIILEKNLEW